MLPLYFKMCMWCTLQFPCENDVRFIFTPHLFYTGFNLFHVLFVNCIDLDILMMFVSFNTKTGGATRGAGTAYPFHISFCWVLLYSFSLFLILTLLSFVVTQNIFSTTSVKENIKIQRQVHNYFLLSSTRKAVYTNQR